MTGCGSRMSMKANTAIHSSQAPMLIRS